MKSALRQEMEADLISSEAVRRRFHPNGVRISSRKVRFHFHQTLAPCLKVCYNIFDVNVKTQKGDGDMKKIMFIALILVLFMFSSCAKIEEAKAQEIANQLFEHIENDDYISASALFCSNEDDGKTFSEFLDEVEIATGLDFQSNIEILEYSEYHSAPNSYFGVVCANFKVKVIVGGEEMMMRVGVLENEDSIECCKLVIYTENNYYQFLCD